MLVNFARYACKIKVIIGIACLAGCGEPNGSAPVAAPMVEHTTSGPIKATIKANPPAVRPDRDVFLTITIQAPRFIEIRMPPIADRLAGFELRGSFDKTPVSENGDTILERRFRLAPTLADEHRLGPIPITVTDNSADPPRETWFATRPILFETVPVHADGEEQEMNDIIGPIRILPGVRTMASWAIWILIAVGLAAAVWAVVRKIKHAIMLRRMSPRERALHELAVLLAKDLVGKKRVKDFYMELTMIVRRYIERAYGIRAPEQTTEEFLAAATSYPRFSKEVIRKLKDFMQSADLVKFAAYRPDSGTINNAVATAEEYIKTDEEAADV